MTITIGRKFEIAFSRISVFVRLPWIGQGFWHRDPTFRAWDRWSTLKELGTV